MASKRYPVVVLHGWMLTSDKYAHLKRELENKKYKVYIPDMPGNGEEPAPKRSWALDDYVQFVKQFCFNNNIKECQIIGHSFGGRVGIKLASENPNLVKKLVLTGVPGFRVESKLRRSLFQIIAKIGRTILLLPFWPSKYTLNSSCSGSGLGHYMKKLLYKLAGVQDYNKTEGVMRETFKKIISQDLRESMRKITSQTLLVWGGEDRIVPVKIAKKIGQLIPDSQLFVVADFGHDLPYRNPDVFVEKLKL